MFSKVDPISSADNENLLACKVRTDISSKGEFPFPLPPPWTDVNHILLCLIYPYAIKLKKN